MKSKLRENSLLFNIAAAVIITAAAVLFLHITGRLSPDTHEYINEYLPVRYRASATQSISRLPVEELGSVVTIKGIVVEDGIFSVDLRPLNDATLTESYKIMLEDFKYVNLQCPSNRYEFPEFGTLNDPRCGSNNFDTVEIESTEIIDGDLITVRGTITGDGNIIPNGISVHAE